MTGLVLAVIAYNPIFHGLAHFANPALEAAQANAPVMVVADPKECSFQFNPTGTARFTSSCDIAKSFLSRTGIPCQAVDAPAGTVAHIEVNGKIASSFDGAADSSFETLEDTFGGRLGYTVEDSHSGYNALRHHLLPYRLKTGAKLYCESIGPLYTPRRVVEAVLAHDVDVGPLDNYAYELMARHEPELAKRLRVVATTDAAPIPALVASPECADDVVQSLQQALMTFGEASACAELRERLCLEGFARVRASDYALVSGWDAEAREALYPHPN